MGDSEDETGYPKKFYSLNRQSHPMYSRPIPKRHAYYHEEEDEDEVDGDEEEPQGGGGYSRGNERFQKRQKPNKPVASGYDFAGPSDGKVGYDWREQEAFVLLEIWGDRFLQLGRRSLRNEDWNEVAEKVSEELRMEKSETQCRRMIDNLKRKYRKEKIKVEKSGLGSSKWAFFNKLDMLLCVSPKSDLGLACGVDSGEFVFMNTKVYLDKSNGFDEMMDSPGDSEEEEDEEDEVDYERKKFNDAASYKMLADSVERFGKVYEKMEKSKKDQMKELEKMRADFQKDLELQKKQIVDRAQSEIARLREEEENYHRGDDESEDEEMENNSDVNLSDE
ncbi:PREDICTED: trihelix transcription factor ASIL2-like [Camelina sativa]|uniref:Trihelix transcription factor ASIL2-like n=1 Tax=Camelina sativa TaxID=90675 RepID=A0ABM0ZBY8_CAMSA|nr:PREDICTED: trihelix transcription factor ASIL2-like [Camelina sativa]